MPSPDDAVLSQALAWAERREALWLCTVLRSWGSAPRPPGALMAVSERGEFSGSLSGGCIETHFLQRLTEGAHRQPSQRVRYGAEGEAPEIALPCGGSLEVLVEYLPAADGVADYLRAQRAALRGGAALEKTLAPGQPARLTPCPQALPGPAVREQDNTLILRLAPAVRLIIAGLSPVADYCITFAHALGFAVLVCEHREQQRATFSAHPALPQFPARYLEQHGCGPGDAILCLTHDAKIDDLTLMEACGTPAFYIGALGSRRNSARRRERLRAIAGLTEEQLARIHAPVGLALGSKTPAEIALAVMADIVRVKNGVGE